MNISRSLFVLAAFLLTGSTIYAQSSFQAGITLGSNYSTLRSDLFSSSNGRAGVAAGASMILHLNDRVELNQEVVFAQKGASVQAVRMLSQENVQSHTYNYHYNTFETGLFAGVQPVAVVPVRFQLGGFFGTHFQQLDNSQRDLYLSDFSQNSQPFPVVKLNAAFSGVDFGPAAGVSVGTQRVRFNARYYFGMRNLYNNLDFVPTGHNIRTRALRVSMTYFLQ